MSKHKQDLPGDRLPLPLPRSPQALDDKILAYARERAPEKQHGWIPRWTNGWAAGLVTASIVAIAVLITETQQPAPIYRYSTESAPLEYEQRDAEDTVMSAPITAHAPAAAKIGREPAPQKKARKQELRAEQVAPQAFGVIAQEEFSDSEIAADTAATPRATLETSKRVRMDDSQLEALHNHFSQLLQQGHEVEAREAFLALRQECPSCDLPETLALWLANKPEDSTP